MQLNTEMFVLNVCSYAFLQQKSKRTTMGLKVMMDVRRCRCIVFIIIMIPVEVSCLLFLLQPTNVHTSIIIYNYLLLFGCLPENFHNISDIQRIRQSIMVDNDSDHEESIHSSDGHSNSDGDDHHCHETDEKRTVYSCDHCGATFSKQVRTYLITRASRYICTLGIVNIINL